MQEIEKTKNNNKNKQNFTIGIDLINEIRKLDHINWSGFVRKAIIKRLEIEKELENQQ